MQRLVQHSLGLVLLSLACCTAQAHDGKHQVGGSAASVKQWDFTLPSLDGRRFVQPSKIDGPVLVNFWGRDCPPCVAELPRLQAFARDNPTWTVLLVATDAPSEASQFLQQRGIALQSLPNLQNLRSGANVGALMRSGGNRHGALPFSVAVTGGAVCKAALGEVSDEQLAKLKAGCAAPR